MGQYLTWAIDNIRDTPTESEDRLLIYYNSTAAVDDTSNAFTLSGSWPGATWAVNVSIPYGGGSQLIVSSNIITPKIYGAVNPISFSASFTGINYWGASAVITASGGKDVAARAYSAPVAATGLAATRVSDTNFSLAWTNNASTGAPISSQNIERRIDDGAWATVASGLSGAATSATGLAAAANGKFEWRVVAIGPAGTSYSGASAAAYTTPSTPGTPTATRSGSNIVLAFTNAAAYDEGIKVYESQNGGAYALLATVATADLLGYTHVAPSSAVNHQYKVATYSGSLISAQSAASNIVYTAPAAATGVIATRVSDSQQTVGWSIAPTAVAPITSQTVQRQQISTIGGALSAWSSLGTVSGSAVNFPDSTTVGNRQYRYRILTNNAAGSATSVESADVYTPPAAPTGLTATKNASDDIVLAFTRNVVPDAHLTYIQQSVDGGASWAALTTLASGVASYTHINPDPAQTHQYRANVVIDAAGKTGDGLTSGYAISGTIQLLINPNPPTIITTSITSDAGATKTLEWVHNSVDTTPQSKYQLRKRINGGAWAELTAVTSPAMVLALVPSTWAAVNGDSVDWSVRTWGSYIDPSAWSDIGTITLSSTPTVAVSSPVDASTLGLSTIDVAWLYYQAEGTAQATWRVILTSGGSTLETKSGSGTTSSTTLATKASNFTDYTIAVEVRSALGIWSVVDSVTVSIDYLPPAAVGIEASYTADWGYAVITLIPSAAVVAASVDALLADVERSIDGGVIWVAVDTAQDVDLASGVISAIDPIPSIRGTTLYRATVVSAIPSTIVTANAEIVVDERMWLFYNYGPGLGTVVKAFGNLVRTSAAGIEQSLEAFDERPIGVLMTGTTTTRTYSAAFTLDDIQSSLDDWEEAATTGKMGYVRDAYGRRMHVGLFGVTATGERRVTTAVTAEFREADYA